MDDWTVVVPLRYLHLILVRGILVPYSEPLSLPIYLFLSPLSINPVLTLSSTILLDIFAIDGHAVAGLSDLTNREKEMRKRNIIISVTAISSSLNWYAPFNSEIIIISVYSTSTCAQGSTTDLSSWCDMYGQADMHCNWSATILLRDHDQRRLWYSTRHTAAAAQKMTWCIAAAVPEMKREFASDTLIGTM